ncbi:unnamed protein product [Jaminaea pallidilutea]
MTEAGETPRSRKLDGMHLKIVHQYLQTQPSSPLPTHTHSLMAREMAKRESASARASQAPPSVGPSNQRLPAPTSLLLPPLAHLVSLYPFQSVASSALPLLSEITHHYLQLLSRLAAQNAQHAGRSTLNVWDIMGALAQVGAGGVDELGVGPSSTSRPRWMSAENDLRKDWQERSQNGWSGVRARAENEMLREAWAEHVAAGRSKPKDLTEMRLMHLTEAELEHWQQFRAKDDGLLEPRPKKRRLSMAQGGGSSDEEDESLFDDDDRPSPTTTAATTTSPYMPFDDDGLRYAERVWDGDKGSAGKIAYIPSFLPPLPGQSGERSITKTEDAPLPDLVVKAEPRSNAIETHAPDDSRGQDGEPAIESTTAITTSAPTATTATAAAAQSPYFAQPIAFTESTVFGRQDDVIDGADLTGALATAQPADATLPELPSTSKPPRTQPSSIPALITALTSLSQSGEMPAYLSGGGPGSSNSGSTSSLVSTSRRRLASLLAQPSRYEPSDVLYSSLPARPSCLPWIPGPSHLVTLPSTVGAAPHFTPTRPKGRSGLSMGSVGGQLGGVSTPTLGYRHPRMSEDAARYFLSRAPLVAQAAGSTSNNAGGAIGGSGEAIANPSSEGGATTVRSSTLHRSLHLFDPEPLRDESHVERVFRGMPLSGGSTSNHRGDSGADPLLRRGESWLKGAVDSLKTSTGSSAEDAVGQGGTLVYTWDWTQRDPAEVAVTGATGSSGGAE